MKHWLIVIALLCLAYESSAQIIRASSMIKVKSQKTQKVQESVEKGFQHSIEVDATTMLMSANADKSWNVGAGVQYIGGYRFSNTIFLGAGVGVEYHKFDSVSVVSSADLYYNMSYDKVCIPLYLHFRAYLSKTRWQPYFFLSAGGLIGTNGNVELANENNYKYNTCGVLATPGFGLNYRISNQLSVYLGVAYSMRSCPYVVDFSANNATLKHSLCHGASIKLGCTF